jgi:hypothetical protein
LYIIPVKLSAGFIPLVWERKRKETFLLYPVVVVVSFFKKSYNLERISSWPDSNNLHKAFSIQEMLTARHELVINYFFFSDGHRTRNSNPIAPENCL